MKTIFVWISSLTMAVQLTFVAAPHPFGTPHKPAPELFMPRVNLQPRIGEPAKTKVVCGMLILEGSPRFDPKMTVEPPKNIQFAIGSYPRPACGKSN